jgi:hypothetical protein
MSFMLMWSGPPQTAEQAATWHKRKRLGERKDGSFVQRWTRVRYDSEAQLEHTEDRYEVLVDGAVVETEEFSRSPATRWYTQEPSRALYQEAGFADVRLTAGCSQGVAPADDKTWTAIGLT